MPTHSWQIGFSCSSSLVDTEFYSIDGRCSSGVPFCVITDREPIATDYEEPRCILTIEDAVAQCSS